MLTTLLRPRLLHRRRSWITAFLTALLVAVGMASVPTAAHAAGPGNSWNTVDPNGTTPDSPNGTLVNGQALVVIRGNDNQLWYSRNGGPFHPLGGVLQAAPVVAEFRGSAFVVTVGQNATPGTGGNIWYREFVGVNPTNNADIWGNWASIAQPAGVIFDGTVRPTVVADRLSSVIHIFAVGTNERMYHIRMNPNGSTIGGWAEVPGAGRTDYAMTAAMDDNGELFLFHRGISLPHHLYSQIRDGAGNWSGRWLTDSSDAGLASSASATFVRDSENRPWIYVTARLSEIQGGSVDDQVPWFGLVSTSNPTNFVNWNIVGNDDNSNNHGQAATTSPPSVYNLGTIAATTAVIELIRWLRSGIDGNWVNHAVQKRKFF